MKPYYSIIKRSIWEVLVAAVILTMIDLIIYPIYNHLIPAITAFRFISGLIGQSYIINLVFLAILIIPALAISLLFKKLTKNRPFWKKWNTDFRPIIGAFVSILFLFASTYIFSFTRDWIVIISLVTASIILSVPLVILLNKARTITRPLRKSKPYRITATLIVAAFCVVSFTKVLLPEIHALFPRQYPEPERPNVVIIIFDAMRRDAMSVYNPAGYAQTPNLDEIAAKGVAYEYAFAPSTWTVPSVIAMLTSQYPRTTGIPNRLHENIPVLAELLYETGYDTHAIISNPILNTEVGFDRGFSKYEQFLEFDELYGVERSTNYLFLVMARNFIQTYVLKKEILHTSYTRYNSEWCTDRTRRFLENRKSKTRPFFLYVHYFDPHNPLWTPEKYIEDLDVINKYGGIHPKNEKKKDYVREMYAAECRHLDDKISEIWSTLENSGMADNTVFIITSDHGEELMERGVYDHGHTMYPELTYIPLIIVYPKGTPHAPSKYPVGLIDIMPTILEAAQVETRPDMNGRSLIIAPSDDKEINLNRSIYIEWTRSYKDTDLAVYKNGRYRIMDESGKGGVTLDIEDFKNGYIWPSDENPELARLIQELDIELEAHREKINGIRSSRGISEEVFRDRLDVDRLKQLGYI